MAIVSLACANSLGCKVNGGREQECEDASNKYKISHTQKQLSLQRNMLNNTQVYTPRRFWQDFPKKFIYVDMSYFIYI